MSLSRRYRPQRFADITDQDAIKETLRKEVASGNLGHAYLFSGPRGVGKTTIARIFAKALNCERPENGEPCLACGCCLDAQQGRLVDVIEMDAASHTGVDNIREAIVEHVRFAPSRGRFKMYILDEAHMLSTSAWNALLKTLEEPPSYAIFVLATTELHKVPATILSRCQRFDFSRIPAAKLAERISWLAAQEQVRLDESVVMSIVKHADGCVRDAETLLDQILALGETDITSDIASLVLPISRLPIAAHLLAAGATRDLDRTLAAIAQCDDEGIPFMPLFDDALAVIRALLHAAGAVSAREALQAGDEGERAIAELMGCFSPAELHDMALVFMERRRDAKQGVDPRFAFELALSPIALGILPHGPGSVAPSTPLPTIPPSSGSNHDGAESSSPPASKTKTRTAEPPSSAASLSSPLPSSLSESGPLTLALVQRKWSAFTKAVGEKNASLTFILTISRPVAVQESTVTVRFQYPFHRDKILGDLKNRAVVEEALRSVLEVGDVRLDAVVGEDAQAAERRADDMVTNILKAFGGQVVDDASVS